MGTQSPKDGKELEALGRLIEEIALDAYGDDEQLRAYGDRLAEYPIAAV